MSYPQSYTRPTHMSAALRVVVRKRTYLNALYVLLAFPLGLGYAVFLLAGLLLDIVLLATRLLWPPIRTLSPRAARWPLRFIFLLTRALRMGVSIVLHGGRVGGVAPALRELAKRLEMRQRESSPRKLASLDSAVRARLWLFSPALWWRMGEIERSLTVRWLGVEIPPMSRPQPGGLARSERFKKYAMDGLTWTSLLYLLMKLPLGALGWTAAGIPLALAAQTLALAAQMLTAPVGREMDGFPSFVAFTAGLLFLCLAGIIALTPLPLLAGLAWIYGRFAQIMLGASDTARRLVETQALAKREQAKAERAEQSRRELIVNVGHELRTPTASIRGHVESLLLAMEDGTGATSPAEVKNYLGIVHRETERLGSLVDELLALARADAGELRLELAPVTAGEVVEEVYQTLAPLARRERRVTVVRMVEPELPRALADRGRLSQVLLNLVRNAITYTPAGGIVSIGVSQPDAGHIEVSVADTGPGIPAQDLGRIFERFYRTDESRSRASGGFGLGLAIVRDLMEAMGGSVTAHSIVGEGSCFRVVLPIAGDEG